MKNHAIIVAGGTGNRMQGDIPKQFMLLNGKPVIQYSMEAFHLFDPALEIILVIHPGYLEYWDQLCIEYKISIPHKVVPGSETRFDSVKNGLQQIEDGLVAIHDAARPLISADFIGRIFSEAGKYGSAMPGIPLYDTIRIIEGNTSRQLDRTVLRAMQTPQVFKVSELKQVYKLPYQAFYTDDASVMQSAGFDLHLMEGRAENIKITQPKDFAVAEALMKYVNP
ncbi:MAG: 2-C-methyl-D-erythritol 4-phosphate cytidylyltransferase [Bacteroidota bacterium]